jgi:hypothetical protein
VYVRYDGKRPARGGAQTVEEFMDTFCKLQREEQSGPEDTETLTMGLAVK